MTHATTRPHDTSSGRDGTPADQATAAEPAAGGGAGLARAALSLIAGLALLAVVFANLDRVADWAAEHGRVWVYLGFFLVMSIAGRLFWWGADTLLRATVAGTAKAPQR